MEEYSTVAPARPTISGAIDDPLYCKIELYPLTPLFGFHTKFGFDPFWRT